MNTASARKGLSLLASLAFACPGLCIGALAVAVPVYLPNHYASRLGLPLAAVGLAFTGVRLLDILFDPSLGVVMDRTRSRFGRYRPWMLAGAPIFMLGVYQLFMAHAGVTTAHLIGWLAVFYVGYSIILLSHISWASTIATDYSDRSRLFGWIQLVSVAGAVAILVLPAVLTSVAHISGGGAVHAMGWLLFALAPFGVLMALSTTHEPPPHSSTAEHFSLKDYWEMLARPDMRRIVTAEFCLTLGPGWMSALYLFYFHDARGFTLAQSNLLLIIYIAAGLIGAAVNSRLAAIFGKHRTMMVCSTSYSLGLVAMTLLPRGDLALTLPCMFLMGFVASAFTMLDRAMVADVSDAVRLETGRQRIGVLFALITSTQKLAGALSIGLTFIVLNWIGYNAKAGAINTPQAIHGLELDYLLGPVLFVMLGGACYIGYKLDGRRHAEIRAQLDARDAQTAAAAASPTAAPTIGAALVEQGLG